MKSREAKVRSISKALTRKKPAAKKVDSKYVDPDKAPIYYLKNRETLKLEIHSSKTEWNKLDTQQQKYIKQYCLFSRTKGAWISKATYDRATYLKSQLAQYGIPEAAPIGERTSFDERFEQKRERADRRSERYSVKADKTRDEADRNTRKAVDMLRVVPMGQPILVGHHSERGHRRLLQKSDDAMRRSVEGDKKADYYDRRSSAAQDTAEARQLQDSVYLRRRIDENQKTINKFKKNWKPGTFETRDAYIEATEKLAFYQRKLSELYGSSGVAPSKEVLKNANAHYVKNRFGWHEIVRINEKTVTVKTPYSWTEQIAYANITDWKSKEEAAPAPKKPTKTPRKEKVTRLKKAVKKKKAVTPAKPKRTAKAKAGRKAATTMKKVRTVQVARATKRTAVKAPVKKVTKAAELKKQREQAGRELKKGMSAVGVIKIGRMVNSMYRTPGSQHRDNPVTHKKVLAPTEENLKKWINRPGKYDLVGVDTGSQTVTIRKKKEGKLDKTTKTFLKKK